MSTIKTKAHIGFALILFSFFIFFHCRARTNNSGAIEVSGLIEAIETEIRSQVQGEVKELLAQEGQKISEGDMLCLVDDEKLTIQLSQVHAAQEGARAKLRLFKKGTKKELIASAKNQKESAEKEKEIAEKTQMRMERLFKEGAVSEAQKEQADLKLKSSQERLETAEENYRLALRGREKEEIDIVEAEIKNLQAQEQFLLRQIRDTKIVSPVKGYLETRHIEKGELILPGALLFSLIDLDRTYVKAYIPEKYIGKITLGKRVEVFCDSFPDQAFKGKVDYISDQAEFAPKNIQTKEERLKLVFMIKSYLENEEHYLKPGMPVDVRISLSE